MPDHEIEIKTHCKCYGRRVCVELPNPAVTVVAQLYFYTCSRCRTEQRVELTWNQRWLVRPTQKDSISFVRPTRVDHPGFIRRSLRRSSHLVRH